LASCKADLDNLVLDFSSKKASEERLAAIESKLTKEQFKKLMVAITNLATAENRKKIVQGKKYTPEEWDQFIFENQKKALDKKSVALLID
tara:strand:- start:651 stop:920 length:270 start_codon:yes stop_codon:yes gene_type:complete